jgi:hypothetical protein
VAFSQIQSFSATNIMKRFPRVKFVASKYFATRQDIKIDHIVVQASNLFTISFLFGFNKWKVQLVANIYVRNVKMLFQAFDIVFIESLKIFTYQSRMTCVGCIFAERFQGKSNPQH